jgi:hypothetical protein
MLKAGAVMATLTVAGIGAAVGSVGTSGAIEGAIESCETRPTSSCLMAPDRLPSRQQVAARGALWQPDPDDPRPFGPISNEWDNHPELIPTTWDVQIVPASRGRQR